jgi:hypothetical protein
VVTRSQKNILPSANEFVIGLEKGNFKTILSIRDSSVGTATGYDWTAEDKFCTEARDFSLLHSVQTDSWGPSGLLIIGYRGLFLRVKAREA